MKLPNWLKIIWWVLLTGFFAFLLFQRYASIMSGATSATDIVIFLILIALLVIPLFQEVSIFGVSFKKEIDSLKSEVKEQIVNLRSDIQNTINMRTEISPQIYVTPPADSELPSIEQRIQPILEQVLREQGIERPVPTPEELTVSDDASFLFSVRYTIERELRRIWKQWKRVGEVEGGPPPPLHASALHIARSLADLGVINRDLLSVIGEVHASCSSAIHGEEVSEVLVNFVRDVSPSLIASLKAIQ